MKKNMKSKVAVGFNNGIGNFIVMSPVLQLIAKRKGDLYLFLDIEWEGEQKEAVKLLAKNMPFIKRVMDFKHKWELEDYEYKYMSRHGRVDNFFRAVNKHVDDIEKLPSWGGDLIHELEFLVYEACDVLHMSPAIYAQYTPHKKPNVKLPQKYVCFSNSYLRSKDGLWDKKSWPHWERFVKTFLKYYDDLDIVLLGGEDDREWGKIIVEIDHKRIIDLTDKTDVLETAGIIKASKALVSTDTFVMHVADALKIPGVVLFGPSLVSKSGPWNGTILPIRSTVRCAPCQGTITFAKCHNYKCMDMISPEMVMAGVRKILH